MINTTTKYHAGVIGLLVSSTLMAGSVTLPNTFSSGTPARSGEVNANFNSVKAAVDDNDAQISQLITRLNQVEEQLASQRTVFLKANGQNIAVLAGFTFSTNEYIFGVNSQTGKLSDSSSDGNIFFSGANCTGSIYLRVKEPSAIEYQGKVLGSPISGDPIPAYYVARGTVPIVITPVSWYVNDACLDNFNSSPTEVYPLFPNDPAITGVENSYTPPYSRWILRSIKLTYGLVRSMLGSQIT